MTCPVCNGDTKVQRSRTDGEIVCRIRKCRECNHVFYTTEMETKDALMEFYRLDRNYINDLRSKKRGVKND